MIKRLRQTCDLRERERERERERDRETERQRDCDRDRKTDKTKCENYRPISLLSSVGKVLEKCVQKHVFNNFRANNLLIENQSGFIPGDSTTFQLLQLFVHTMIFVNF